MTFMVRATSLRTSRVRVCVSLVIPINARRDFKLAQEVFLNARPRQGYFLHRIPYPAKVAVQNAISSTRYPPLTDTCLSIIWARFCL